MIVWLAIALCVIILPGLFALMWGARAGVIPGIIVLGGMMIWTALSWQSALAPGSAPIAPEFLGGETISYRQRTGVPEAAWTFLVFVPGTLWTALAVLIGRALYKRPQRKAEHP